MAVAVLPTSFYLLNIPFLGLYLLSKKFLKNYEDRIFNTIKQIDYHPKNKEFQFFLPGRDIFVEIGDLKILQVLKKSESWTDFVLEVKGENFYLVLKSGECEVYDKDFLKSFVSGDFEEVKKYSIFK